MGDVPEKNEGRKVGKRERKNEVISPASRFDFWGWKRGMIFHVCT